MNFVDFDFDKLETIELINGLSSTEMESSFFDKNALVEPPYKVFQVNSNDGRYYYYFNEKGEPIFYPSVTTVIQNTLKQSPHLIAWIAKNGLSQSDNIKMDRAYYGTFMHALFERYLIQRGYNLDSLRADLLAYMEYHKLPTDFINNEYELKKDLLAFAQFCSDYDVKPVAIEVALISFKDGYAGMIDLPCSMLERPNSNKRINAIVDFKSGRKGFYEEHEIQLHLYKNMWNENFPAFQIDRVFNFSPKDWRKKPTYNLKDQTNAKSALKIPYLLGLAEVEDVTEKTFTSISGVIDMDNLNVDDNIKILDLADTIKNAKLGIDKPKVEDKGEIKPKSELLKDTNNESDTTTPKEKDSLNNELLSGSLDF